MSEANLWKWLRGVALPLGQYSRIETGDTAPGFPDVHCQLGPGISPTLELKFSRHPNRVVPFTSKDGMRKSQLRWIRDNIRNGGVVWVIAEATPDIYIIPGLLVELVNGSTREELSQLSTEIIWRSAPQQAAKILHQILVEQIYD